MNNSTKDLIRNLIKEAAGKFFPSRLPPFKIDVAKKKEWGDLSTNLPFLLAGKTGNSPEVMGKNLVSLLSKEKIFSRVDFAAPGFINFFLSSSLFKLISHFKNRSIILVFCHSSCRNWIFIDSFFLGVYETLPEIGLLLLYDVIY